MWRYIQIGETSREHPHGLPQKSQIQTIFNTSARKRTDMMINFSEITGHPKKQICMEGVAVNSYRIPLLMIIRIKIIAVIDSRLTQSL